MRSLLDARDRAIEQAASDTALTNRTFYDALWSRSRLARPERFNTWPLIAGLFPSAAARLEIGPGLRPRLPISGTHFIDISAPVIEQLNARGALAQPGDVTVLPFHDDAFDLVCAFDIVEHLEDDTRAFGEISRVLKKDGILILSVPLHAGLWSAFDEVVGHVRRYEPSDLLTILERHHLVLEKSALFGMQPASPRLLACGMWFLTHRRSTAMFWYNLFVPLSLMFQKRLEWCNGLLRTEGVSEIVLVCRRG
jgi:SAM-dependent methyltransferase